MRILPGLVLLMLGIWSTALLVWSLSRPGREFAGATTEAQHRTLLKRGIIALCVVVGAMIAIAIGVVILTQ